MSFGMAALNSDYRWFGKRFRLKNRLFRNSLGVRHISDQIEQASRGYYQREELNVVTWAHFEKHENIMQQVFPPKAWDSGETRCPPCLSRFSSLLGCVLTRS
jgi:hypothetical protein